jgi:hypothetical protein
MSTHASTVWGVLPAASPEIDGTVILPLTPSKAAANPGPFWLKAVEERIRPAATTTARMGERLSLILRHFRA